MDVLKIVQKYVEDTGSTWYFPDKNNYLFEKGVERGVLAKRSIKGKVGYTTPKIAKQEERIAKFAVARMITPVKQIPEQKLNMLIDLYEAQEGIKLDEWQREAARVASNSSTFVLTGGPGTGKTCVLKCIRFCLMHTGVKDIQFCAPTGKASRRITESVGVPACTVAKAFRLVDEDAIPRKITNEAIVVDEISMLDTNTAHALFTATPITTRMILVGDVEQLPSVGCGSILRDLIDSEVIPYTKLEKTFRQASESGLFANIEQVKKGLHAGFVERDDFKVFSANTTEDSKKIMVDEFLSAVETYGIDNVVCLTPFRRKGEACAIKLNNELQEILNPKSDSNKGISYTTIEEDGFKYRQTLRVGDPVMQLVNATKVANGDVGRVSKVDIPNLIVYVQFIDCEVRYSAKDLGQLALAYAMSVHKSQGSEYACVITSAIESDFDMLSRNTIYTAITRAKKECRVITGGDVAKRACEREVGYERKTGLTQAMQHEYKKYKMLSALL